MGRFFFGILGEEEGERRSDEEGTNPDLEGLQAGTANQSTTSRRRISCSPVVASESNHVLILCT